MNIQICKHEGGLSVYLNNHQVAGQRPIGDEFIKLSKEIDKDDCKFLLEELEKESEK